MIRLLDCTLRDGGFVNDWNFGYSSIRSIVGRLDKAGIEIIEVGFIDDRREYDKNRSIFPDVISINSTLTNLSVNQALLVGMIDFGSCSLDEICLSEHSILGGIRVIFKKKDINAALAYCSEIRAKGYKIFLNPVSLTSYSDKEILELVEKINDFNPYAMSIVDTYGLMLRSQILHYVGLIDFNLKPTITLAYHSHNNQQMAYANCCTLIDYQTNRDIILDTTLYGMGKSAGNANTELVASYTKHICGKVYKVEQLLECIYSDIMPIYKQTLWGYNLHYLLSALNDCHPSYIKFLLEKNSLNVDGIYDIVSKIPIKERLTYSETLIERLYIEYLSIEANDVECLHKLHDRIANRNILMICPGTTIISHKQEIDKYIEYNNPVTISVNFIPLDFCVDFAFVGNRKRYDKLMDSYFHLEKRPHIIATSNILESTVPIDYSLNYESLILGNSAISDYGSVMCLNLLRKLEMTKISIAGMDGFSGGKGNFGDKFMEMYDSKDMLIASNNKLSKFIVDLQVGINITFLTPTSLI